MPRGFVELFPSPELLFRMAHLGSFFLMVSGSPYAIYTIAIPILMLHFLLNVSGIPLAEKQALKSRPESYAEYQKEVSAFVPWFPKRRKAS